MNPPFGLTQIQFALIVLGAVALALIVFFGARIWMLRRRRVARVEIAGGRRDADDRPVEGRGGEAGGLEEGVAKEAREAVVAVPGEPSRKSAACHGAATAYLLEPGACTRPNL